MTKGYVKDIFGNDTEMQSWIFDNGIKVYEEDFDNDLHCLAVYNRDEKLGTIYPDNIGDMESCIESLDAGEDPISGHWEDGRGNLCTLDGWGIEEDDNKMDFEDFQKTALEGSGVQNDDKQVWVNVEGKQYTVNIDDVLDGEEKEPFEASFCLENHLDHDAWQNLYDQYLTEH